LGWSFASSSSFSIDAFDITIVFAKVIYKYKRNIIELFVVSLLSIVP